MTDPIPGTIPIAAVVRTVAKSSLLLPLAKLAPRERLNGNPVELQCVTKL